MRVTATTVVQTSHTKPGGERQNGSMLLLSHRQGNQARHTRAGDAIAAHENMKRQKYPNLLLAPLVCSHLGRAGKELVTFTRGICRNPDVGTRTVAIAQFWQSWACTVQQWNVKILSSSGRLVPA